MFPDPFKSSYERRQWKLTSPVVQTTMISSSMDFVESSSGLSKLTTSVPLNSCDPDSLMSLLSISKSPEGEKSDPGSRVTNEGCLILGGVDEGGVDEGLAAKNKELKKEDKNEAKRENRYS